jgi:glycosyltransferase involved in cell wall biosynthesis
MVERMAVLIAPSPKTAAALEVFGRLPEVRVIPTPVPAVPASADVRAVPASAGSPGSPGSPGSAGSAARVPTGVPAGSAKAAPTILSVGRVSPEKNPGLLLEAFARVVARKPDARLILLGVQRDRHRLRRQVAALGLAGRVDLVPPVPHDEVAGYYAAADVLAFPATTDTQSLVLSEAEAAGLPAVVADRALAERPGGPDSGSPDSGSAGFGSPDSGSAGLGSPDSGSAGFGSPDSGSAGLGSPDSGSAGFGSRQPGIPAPARVTCDPTPESFADALLAMLDDAGLRDRTAAAGLAATAAYPPSRYRDLLLAAYERAASTVHGLRPSTP